MNKKLQVFVSSTYTDLIEERQAAVQAILDAGHIPAGMELFKAGKSQMETIRKWIDESDIYMLILGGRYGSIESESGLSYTELEYRYALSKNMPVFAVVLSESFLIKKIASIGLYNAMEQYAPEKYNSFKSLVMSKIISLVNENNEIKIAIHATLNMFVEEYNLVGWVRNTSENDIVQFIKDASDKIAKNKYLTAQTQKLQQQFGNCSLNELLQIAKEKISSATENGF